MGILSGILSYLLGLTLNLLDAAINGFLGALGFDLDTFEQYFPAASKFHDVIVGFAVGLLFIMLVFQIFRNFGVVLDMEAEDPLKMLGKTALYLGMILNSRSIINLILELMTDPYTIFLGAASSPYQFELLTLVTSIFTSVFSNPFMNIVAVILMLVLGWQFLKLTVECVERYIVFYFALYCAPVVFATGAFKSTAQILKSWCRLVGSQAMLLLINVWSIKLFLSFMPVFEQSGANMVFTFLMGYAFLKFAQKADTLLRILGLNTASTGDMARSLGAAAASIAMTIRMAAGMASSVGKHFGGAAATGKSGVSEGGPGQSSADEISGMGSRRGDSAAQPEAKPLTPQNEAEHSVTVSGISAAKQGYITDVMRAARSRMEGGPFGGAASESDSAAPETGVDSQNTEETVQEGKIPLGSSEATKPAEPTGFQNLDEETLEGLSNLAHGLPHDHFDAEKGSYTGGGFPAFTGADANIIGASQLTPAEGVERSAIKRTDGSFGTVYRNAETGEASLVQFSSVDNGVIQGSISSIDPQTGKVGQAQPFTAVHSSLPGAESLSGNSVAVREPSGGAYHITTDGDTSIFSASAYTPGGASKMAAADKLGSADMLNTTESTAVSGPSGLNGVNTVETINPHTVESGVTMPPGGENTVAQPSSLHENQITSDIQGETPITEKPGSDPPPIFTGMQPPQNRVRRFSKNNPANLAAFQKDGPHVEAFEKNISDSEAPPIDPPSRKT